MDSAKCLAPRSPLPYLLPMPDAPPPDPADHAEEFAHRWADRLDEYCALRMEELGIPDHLHGAPDLDGDGKWRAFIAHDRVGGRITTGITVNSGVLNPKLLTGKGSRVWERARPRHRIDAIIAHEFEEDRTGTHEGALKAAPRTELPITDGARRILKAMGR